MKKGQLAAWSMMFALATGLPAALAQEPGEAETAEATRAQQAYEQAMQDAERERAAAQAAVEQARQEVERAAQMRERAAAELASAQQKTAEQERQHRAEADAMRQELSRIQEELRRASREVVRAHRELEPMHTRAPRVERSALGSKAVIGVILGDSDDRGVLVVGVSPGGPAERAGIRQGDVVVAVMGKPLVTEDGPRASTALMQVMQDVKPGDEVGITVQRDDGATELTLGVVAEEREPVSWTSLIRLPSAPDAPDAPIVIEELIEVPQIDQQALAEKMKQLQSELGRSHIVLKQQGDGPLHVAPEAWEFEFENLSDIGEEALYSANVWIGMPMTRGLKLAEVDAALGEYFKTDHGVLVLSAEADNELQLEAGDVLLKVAGKRVEKPVDVMRELRAQKSGETVQIEIMRKRKSKELEVVVPERKLGFGFAPAPETRYSRRWRIERG